jgi:hypothetical protein
MKEKKENEFIGYVYGLYDPITDELRYVGYTTKSIEERCYHHIKDSVYKNKTHKTKWINNLLKENLQPVIKPIEILESNDFDQLLEKLWYLEDFYIQKYKNEGIKLTNGNDGGKGGRFTEEVRKKMSEIQKGEKSFWWGKKHSEETKIKIGLGNKNKVFSEETRKRIGEKSKGRVFSEETKKKISEKSKETNRSKSKLNIDLVNEIRFKYLKGIKREYIFDEYAHINTNTLSGVLENKTWTDDLYSSQLENMDKTVLRKHSEKTKEKLSILKKGVTGEKSGGSKLKQSEVDFFRELYLKGGTPKQISKNYNISKATLLKILYNYTWPSDDYYFKLKQKRGL